MATVAGFQVINDNGHIQIDQNFKNLAFKEKFTWGTAGVRTVSSTNCVNPVPVVYTENSHGIAIVGMSRSGSTYTFKVDGIGDLYIFDSLPVSNGSTSGLQVFNAAGQLVFDANAEYLKPVAISEFFPPDVNVSPHTFPGIGSWPTPESGAPGYSKYALNIPSNKKWGLILQGAIQWVWDHDYSWAADSGSGIEKGYWVFYRNGANSTEWKIKRRSVGYPGGYYPGTSTGTLFWYNGQYTQMGGNMRYIFVDLTGF